jgi:tetraacyldisaccharide 4'-kinase
MLILKRLLAGVYGALVALRGKLYDCRVLKSYISSVPVVSIGNVTAGGNGKTPLCLTVADEMQKRGYSPAILSRGYGGTIRGPHRVSSSDSFRDVGDEAILMAETGIPVFIARKRAAGVRLIEQDPSIDLVILDDGFQHRALARTLDIVSVFVGSQKAVEDFVAGRLLPLGLFRESRDRALERADLVVLSYRSVQQPSRLPELDSRIERLLPRSAGVYRSFLTPVAVKRLSSDEVVAPQRVCAVAAIANPEGFFRSLEVLGFDVVARYEFPDHHVLSDAEMNGVLSRNPECLFVCTSKDAVKLRELSEGVRERIAVLAVSAHVVPCDAFFVQIERAIQSQRVQGPRVQGLRLQGQYLKGQRPAVPRSKVSRL